MANYIKSFNFRNGVQVDNDNFVVNAVGRVGIGTTVPEKLLDVRGNAKVVGHITATDASVSGIVTVGSITINGSTGTISASTFSGSAGNFGDQAVVAISTDGFIAGATGLTTSSNLGIGTDSTTFELQVGSNPETSTGFGVTSGNVTASGNLKISGISTLGVTTVTNLTGQQLSVSGVSTLGVTTTTDLTAQQLNVSGVSTLGVTTVTDLTGQQLSVSGVSTFSDNILIGTGATVGFGSTAYFRDHAKAIFGDSNDLQIYHDEANSYISDQGTGDLRISGNVVKFNNQANTATMVKATQGDSVELYYNNSKKFETTNTGTTVTGIGSFDSIGIQTSAPSADLQIRKASGNATLEVISDTAKASISIGNSVGAGNSSASINYGSTSGFSVFSTNQSLDIINRDSGNVNFSLGNNTTNEKAFHWHRDVGNEQLMSLTKQGYLGIGVTNPTHVLHVAGMSTFTESAYFEDNVTINGTLSFSSSATLTATFKGDVQDTSSNVILDVSQPLLNANVNTASGISTFNRVSAGSTIKTTNLVIGGDDVNRTDSSHMITVNGESTRFFVTDTGAIGISTNTNLEDTPDIGIIAPEKIAILGGVGVGTTTVRCAVDFADAGTVGVGTTQPYFLPPKVSTATRNGIGGTVSGATIYNITLNKLQVYTGSAWETVTSS
jgi:hypothetical protein